MDLPQPAFAGLESVRLRTRLWDDRSLSERRPLTGSTVSGFGSNLVYIYKGGIWLFSTGFFNDSSTTPPLDGTHIFLHRTLTPYSGDALWTMPDNRPEFLLGREEGVPNDWYSGDVLHPEVVRVDNIWYMYSQVQIPIGKPIDKNHPDDEQQFAETRADRIMLCVSGDCDTWTRMSKRGVIQDIEFPTQTQLMNPMVIHVPWDPYGDGRIWWLYVAAQIQGGKKEFYQIRSSDPQTFSWNNRILTHLPEYANQVAFIKEAPGGPLFFCFTCTIGTQRNNDGRMVPSMCFSRDGLSWSWGKHGIPIELMGSTDSILTNCMDPSISSLNGAGQLVVGTGYYRSIYCVSTTDSKTLEDVSSHSKIGYGDILINLHPTLSKGTPPPLISSPSESPSSGASQTPSPPPSNEVFTVPLDNLPADARPLRLVKIPAGTCMMGNQGNARGEGDNLTDVPCHSITIGSDFYMGETEFTVAQWRSLMGSVPASETIDSASSGDHPVHFVSWDDITGATGCIQKLNALGLGQFRLPSEAEWEYACRGPASNSNRYAPFSFGDEPALGDLHLCDLCKLFGQHMWYCGNTTGSPMSRAVGEKSPNGFGLYDMHGNAAEWCQDGWHVDYNGAPKDGSVWNGETGNSYHVIRGGSWYTVPAECCSSSRSYRSVHSRDSDVGFRVLMTR